MNEYIFLDGVKKTTIYAPMLEWEWVHYLFFGCSDQEFKTVLYSLPHEAFAQEDIASLIKRAQRLFFEEPGLICNAQNFQNLVRKHKEYNTFGDAPDGGPDMQKFVDSIGNAGIYIEKVGYAKVRSQIAEYALKRELVYRAQTLFNAIEKGSSVAEIEKTLKERGVPLAIERRANPNFQKLYGYATAKIGENETTLNEQLLQTLKSLEEPKQQTFVQIGAWDKLIGGLYNKEFYLVHGPSGVTKTGFIVNMAFNMAKQNKPVIIFSHEEDPQRIIWRILSRMTGIPFSRIKNRQLGAEDWSALTAMSYELSQLDLEIIDGSGYSPTQIMEKCQEYKKKKGIIGGIFIDSFAFIDWGNGEIYQRANAGGQFFKLLAHDMECPVVAICHNSTKGSRESGPSKYNVEGGEGLTRPAWVCVELRLDEKDPGFGSDAHVMAYVTKNRDGPTNQAFRLIYTAGDCTFRGRDS